MLLAGGRCLDFRLSNQTPGRTPGQKRIRCRSQLLDQAKGYLGSSRQQLLMQPINRPEFLTAGNTRVQIKCGGATAAKSTQEVRPDANGTCPSGTIWYAEHRDATIVTSMYLVNWTAPSSANVGKVRFNLEGMPPTATSPNQGDFIYTRIDYADPAARRRWTFRPERS